MMAELQKKQDKRRFDALSPEEQAAEIAKRNPVISRDNINSQLAAFENSGGTQEAPTNKIIIGKGAPPPPPPPPPPPALKGMPPGGAKPAVVAKPPGPKPAQPQQTPQSQPIVVQQQQQQQQQPVVQQQQQQPVVQKQQPQQQESQNEPSYPNPKQQAQKVDSDVNYVAPQNKQAKSQVQVNFFSAIVNKNLADDLSKVVFENKEEVLNIYAPLKNVRPQPSFKSIMEGFRELDKNPELAVMYFAKKAKATQNFIRYLPNDNNEWCRKQLLENLEKLKAGHQAEISAYIKNNTHVSNEGQGE